MEDWKTKKKHIHGPKVELLMKWATKTILLQPQLPDCVDPEAADACVSKGLKEMIPKRGKKNPQISLNAINTLQ